MRETFYNLAGAHGTAALDIKLLPCAQSKGIAERALAFAIDQAFTIAQAERVYVEPHPDNKRAWVLYAKLGFVNRSRPDYLGDGATYLEITKEEWRSCGGRPSP